MAKFSTANIKRNANGKNAIEIGKTILALVAVESIPGVIQAIGGYNPNGSPKINASGPVWDISTGLGAAAIAYGFDKPQMGNTFLVVKALKQAYDKLNPVATSVMGGPAFLPVGKNGFIAAGSETKDPNLADSVPVTMPDGRIENVAVTSLPSLSDYGVDTAVEMLSEGTDNPFVTQLSDYTNNPLSDYTNEPLSDYTNDPLSDYTNNPLSDYTNEPLSDDFDFFDSVAEGEFD
jgi:hypothetical protein